MFADACLCNMVLAGSLCRTVGAPRCLYCTMLVSLNQLASRIKGNALPVLHHAGIHKWAGQSHQGKCIACTA